VIHPPRVALAIDRPPLEAALIAVLEHHDPPLRVDGRTCEVVNLCASVPELRTALAREDVDLVIVSATLNAMAEATLRDLADSGRPLVLVVADPTDPRWDRFPSPVVGRDPDLQIFPAAIGQPRRSRP
jgi:hypothetical protein